MDWVDFVVWTPTKFFVERVPKHPEFEVYLPKLKKLYFDHLLPALFAEASSIWAYILGSSSFPFLLFIAAMMNCCICTCICAYERCCLSSHGIYFMKLSNFSNFASEKIWIFEFAMPYWMAGFCMLIKLSQRRCMGQYTSWADTLERDFFHLRIFLLFCCNKSYISAASRQSDQPREELDGVSLTKRMLDCPECLTENAGLFRMFFCCISDSWMDTQPGMLAKKTKWPVLQDSCLKPMKNSVELQKTKKNTRK